MNNLFKRISLTILFSIPLCIFFYFDLQFELNNYLTVPYILFLCLLIFRPLLFIRYSGVDIANKKLQFDLVYLLGFIKITPEVNLFYFPPSNLNFLDCELIYNNSSELSPFKSKEIEIQLHDINFEDSFHLIFHVNTNLPFHRKLKIKTNIYERR